LAVARTLAKQWLLGLAGWCLVAPIAALMPRRRDSIAVIGRDEGKFVDNAKYFFLHASPLLSPGVSVAFVTGRGDVVTLLKDTPYQARRYPAPGTIWFLLRAGTFVVDSNEWSQGLCRFLLIRARSLQLWHGVGFKRIELDKWRNEARSRKWLSSRPSLWLRTISHAVTGRRVRYDALNTTSGFYRDRVFAPAFRARQFLVTGYPRNTFGEGSLTIKDVAWRNVDRNVAARLPGWQRDGRRIVLVAPTFRENAALPAVPGPDMAVTLDALCANHGVEMVFKFHPRDAAAASLHGRHLHVCAPESDLYPLMPLSSALVTDYSSIYMDYLLLDRPILFLVPDLSNYIERERDLQFEFDRMTPGAKAGSWPELFELLVAQLERDEHAAARAELRELAFDNLSQQESVAKLIHYMGAQGWIPSGRGILHGRPPAGGDTDELATRDAEI
jgi:CDP-glycerol glycerophosphotransferase (TagB/SpsB family)